MLRICLLIFVTASFFGVSPAQEPPTPPVPKVVEPAPKQQDPKQKGPKQQDPKPEPGEQPKPGATPDDKPAPPKDGGVVPVEEEEIEIDLPEDLPLPESADPADLRAMRSERDMLIAERRMRALIKSGKLAGIDKLLTFEEISSWPYEDALKGMPKGLKKLDGKVVLMTGFMLPIDEVENIKEFLLVQSLWACCYGQPPDINGIVRVVMKGDRRVDYQFDPIQVQGTFKVEATLEDGYCIDIFQLEATKVSLIK